MNEGQVLIDTTNAEISNVIGQKEITQLPLNGRDPASLIFCRLAYKRAEPKSGVGTLPTSNTFLTEVGGSGNGLAAGKHVCHAGRHTEYGYLRRVDAAVS